MTEAELTNGINKIIHNNDIDTAINNLKGYMRLRYGHPVLCENLANLYIEKNDFRQAGKYIFYKEYLSKKDKEILSVYFKYFGNNKINILKDLIAEGTKSPVRIDYDVKVELFIMMNEVKSENGFLPKFMWNWYYHFESKFKKDSRYSQLSQSTRR
ncbi:DUF6584 family protein [Psychrobacter aquaticus]|uniref:DUF6584 family protein n=1 Tax=Psychrobacter aquaticus TaxID=248452 RepID=UPI00058E0609|nr:DUF6584 family protein [Psychrobacter aquaticus]